MSNIDEKIRQIFKNTLNEIDILKEHLIKDSSLHQAYDTCQKLIKASIQEYEDYIEREASEIIDSTIDYEESVIDNSVQEMVDQISSLKDEMFETLSYAVKSNLEPLKGEDWACAWDSTIDDKVVRKIERLLEDAGVHV
jgi:hypothetical protein